MSHGWNIKECTKCGRVYTTQVSCPYCDPDGEFIDRPIKKTKLRKVTEDSPLEEKFIVAWRSLASSYPTPVREHVFHPDRGWAFDFAFIDIQLAIELEGGVFSGGRHVRGQGYTNDTEKYNAAIELGWAVLRYTTVNSDYIEQIKRVYDQRKNDLQ